MLKNKMIWILVLCVVILLGFLFWQFSNFRLQRQVGYNISKACVGENCFDVELAEDNLQIEKGLMFRESLSENKGMIFVFNKEANYPFWMKNTLIPLDIIWINNKKEIVYISQYAQPCKTFFCPQINPQKKAKYVFEINAGLCQKFDIHIGQTVDINL